MSGRRIIIALWLLLLCGCQQWRAPADSGWLALDEGYYQLLDSWPGEAQQLLQQVVWRDANQQRQFVLSALLQPDSMLLVAVSPLGQELWRLNYHRGHQLSVAGIAPFNQPQFAKRLLAEMQLALLPHSLLQPRLKALTLQERDAQRWLRRRDGSTVLHIQQAAQLQPGAQIVLQAGAYQLQITTLQQDFLP
jgi:hypothetical protein